MKTIFAAILLLTSTSFGEVLMTPSWAQSLCEQWNYNDVLTSQLASWMKNDLGRGYKIMLLQREDCPNSPTVQLTIQKQDDLVWCTYGGIATKEPNYDADYLMTAETENWIEMGRGDYGPTRAMLFGKLHFQGPKMEAMNNMTPFSSFLLEIGKVPGDTNVCPQK